MTAAHSAAIRVFDWNGKIRNGLYLKGISVYEDRVVFEVFASRPLTPEELETLELTDDVETQYSRVGEPCVIDGHSEIEFRPALPEGALFSLGQPGWAIATYAVEDEA